MHVGLSNRVLGQEQALAEQNATMDVLLFHISHLPDGFLLVNINDFYPHRAVRAESTSLEWRW